MDLEAALFASLRCWTRLIRAIEALPDSDQKQYELDKIYEMKWMQKPIDIL